MELSFKGEVLTPMFLGSADPQSDPELRAPSVRGALRYWLRALAGGVNWENTGKSMGIAFLQELEREIFGSTDMGSAVSVRVLPENQTSFSPFAKEKAIRTPEGAYLPTGRDYLFWSMAESGRQGDPRYRPARKYIVPGSKFRIILRSVFSAEGSSRKLKKAAAAAWLLGNLGALGSRANRGAGSFQLTLEENVEGLPIFRFCETVEELQEYLARGIEQCLKTLAGETAGWRSYTSPPDYDILAPGAAEIWIVASNKGGWASYNAALNGIGEKIRDFRRYHNGIGKEDHDAVLKWLEEGKKEGGPNIHRAVFGLPLPFRYSHGGAGDVIQSDKSSRRASPLKMRITRLATGAYVGVLFLFKSRFLEEGAKLQLQTRKWTAPAPKDYQVIQKFIGTFPLKVRCFQ